MNAAPPRAERKKPWYLIAALLASLAFGVNGGCNGLHTVAFYRAQLDISSSLQGMADAERAQITALFERFLAAMDAAKGRLFPLAVAGLLVGCAIVFLALRTMAGRASSRSGLIQLIVVQAALAIGAFFVEREATGLDYELRARLQNRDAFVKADPQQREQAMVLTLAVMKVAPPVILVLRTIGSALIVLALTRPRTRQFFEASSNDPVSEQ